MHVREVVTQGGSTDLLHFSSVEIWILSLSGNLTHNEDIVLMPLKNKNIYISPSLCVVIPLPTHYTTFDNRHHNVALTEMPTAGRPWFTNISRII